MQDNLLHNNLQSEFDGNGSQKIDEKEIKPSRVREYLKFIIFLTIVGLLYIFNTHYAEKTVRDIEKLDRELKELKWEYTVIHANLVFNSQESEVAKRVEELGLKELKSPPQKIAVTK